jgi:DNA modification methylase
MNIEEIPIAELDLDPANVRQHDEKNLAAIKSSLKRFGQQKPIVVDPKGIVIAGNGTLTAARALGWDRIRIVRTQLEGSEATAYAIADNRTAELATWDDDALMQQLSALDLEDSALVEAAGFSAAELEGMVDGLLGEKELNEDEVPEVPKDPITKPGDLWILGDHRLLCGDSTKIEDVERLMGGEKADLCFTSPPYGQQRDYTEEGKAKVADWDGLMRGVFGNLPMTDAGQVLVNLGMIHRDGEWIPYWDGWIEWMRSQGWRRFGWYVWDQGSGLPGDWNGRLAPSHEFVWHFNRISVRPDKWIECDPSNVAIGERATAKRAAGGKVTSMRAKNGEVKPVSSTKRNSHKIPDSVIRVSRCATIDMARENHPATFPISFAAFALRSWPGVAYEPFCGSGTTIIAAEQLGRRCFGMEISPQYCDVIVERWENLTGRKAELERRADDDQEKIQSQT